MEGKSTGIVEKGLETYKTSCAKFRCPIIHHIVNQRQNIRLEVEDQERTRKKPGKTPEEVHTTRHYGNNMVDVVRPG